MQGLWMGIVLLIGLTIVVGKQSTSEERIASRCINFIALLLTLAGHLRLDCALAYIQWQDGRSNHVH